MMRISLLCLLLVLLNACGGGGGGGSSGASSASSVASTGVFLDSAVSGINYRTASGSGKTNTNGEFKYKAGETVTFSVGNIDLPPVTANSTITPLDLANTTDINHQVVSNVLVLLQSLDSDGDPSNGIQIPTTAHTAATTSVDFNVSAVAFRANSVVTTLVSNSGSTTTSLVALSTATSHFTNTLASVNVAPVANAGLTQNVLTFSKVYLDGTASSDANNDSLTFSWKLSSKPSGSNSSISDATSSNPSFTPDFAGTYVVSLIVNDGKASSIASTVTVTASNANVAPVANAGNNQNVTTSSRVILNGALSSDANGDTLTYAWTISSKPAGSSATLAGATTANPTFTADRAGNYVIALIVNDGTVNSASSSVTITSSTSNIAPVANSGSAQNVVVGATVTLNGSASNDANGDSLTYLWSFISKPAGSSASLSSTTTVNPTFAPDVAGSYVISLIVSDGYLSSASSNVTVTASTANIAPVANAGVSQSVVTGSTVTLNGSASNDANGDSLTYAWSIVSKPAGSSVTLSSTTTVNPTFIASAAGSYVLRLVVNDGVLSSNASNVTITASNTNLAPVANAGGGLNIYVGTSVTLNGTGSYDPNGDSLLYSWVFVSKPSGSSATLSGATTAAPSFLADAAGSYVIALAVGDGSLVSQISTVTITASPLPVVSGVNLLLYGGANNSVYLGCLTCNQLHAESVCNSFGTYGSSFSSSSIWNQFGTYGNSFNSYSPWNSFSLTGPLIVGTNNLSYGYFTTNSFKVNRTTVQSFLNVLNYYSTTNNLSSTRLYACGN